MSQPHPQSPHPHPKKDRLKRYISIYSNISPGAFIFYFSTTPKGVRLLEGGTNRWEAYIRVNTVYSRFQKLNFEKYLTGPGFQLFQHIQSAKITIPTRPLVPVLVSTIRDHYMYLYL